MNADVTNRILKKIEQVQVQAPDLRFGQLIAIVGELAEDETGLSLWDVDDTDFAAALDRFAGDLAKRESGEAEPGSTADHGGIQSFSGPTAPAPPR